MWVIKNISLKSMREFVLRNEEMDPDELALYYGVSRKALNNYTRSAGLGRFRIGKYRWAYKSFLRSIREINIDLPRDRTPEELIVDLITRGYNDVEIALKLNVLAYDVSFIRRMRGQRSPQSRRDSFCDGEAPAREEFIKDPLPEKKSDSCCSQVCDHLRPLIESLGKYLKHHPE